MNQPPKAIVITGASSGIGRDCALELDRRGFQVFAGYRKEEDAVFLRVDASANLVPLRIDVAEAGSIAEAVAQVEHGVGERGLAGLVNNAGIAIAAPMEFVPLDALRRQLEVNVVGQVAVTQAFLPQIRRASGRIVHMGSISGRVAAPLLGPYSASKYALEALSDSMRIELIRWNIHVALIEPGAIDTPIWSRSSQFAQQIADDFPPEAEKLYGNAMRTLQRRIGDIRATPTKPVVEAVIHALTSERPRARYLVGRDARLRLVLAYLPTRVRDRLIAGALRLR